MSMMGGCTAPGFMSLPFEIRSRIYALLFQSVRLCPVIPDESEIDEPIPSNHFSILLTCHKIHNEALPVFWKTTTFCLRTSDENEIFASPRLLDRLHQIERFELDNRLLHLWPPSSLFVTLPNLKLLTISNIVSEFGHSEVAQIEEGACTFNNEGPQSETSMKLFYSLLMAQVNSARAQDIMSHCTSWQSKYSLKLNFKVVCRHVGMSVVPGLMGMRWGPPHKHEVCEVRYCFERGD